MRKFTLSNCICLGRDKQNETTISRWLARMLPHSAYAPQKRQMKKNTATLRVKACLLFKYALRPNLACVGVFMPQVSKRKIFKLKQQNIFWFNP